MNCRDIVGRNAGLFAPQPVEFEKVMTYTMPAKPLEDHYGKLAGKACMANACSWCQSDCSCANSRPTRRSRGRTLPITCRGRGRDSGVEDG